MDFGATGDIYGGYSALRARCASCASQARTTDTADDRQQTFRITASGGWLGVLTALRLSRLRDASLLRPGAALVLAAAILPALSVFAPLALSPLFFLVSVLEIAAFWRKNGRVPRVQAGVALILAGFVLWGCAAAAFSLDGFASLRTAGKLALMAMLGLLLVAVAGELPLPRRRAVLIALLGGFVAGLALLAVEMWADMTLTRWIHSMLRREQHIYGAMLNRPATVLALLTGPAVGILLMLRRPLVAATLGAAALFAATSGESMAAAAACIVALITLLAGLQSGRVVGVAIAATLAAGITLAPLLPPLVLSPIKDFAWHEGAIPSVFHRIAIWQFTAQRIADRPFLGWGLDAARRLPGGHEGIRATNLELQSHANRDRVSAYLEAGNIEQMPLHPHNGPLQIWLEAGAPGGLLTALFVFVVLRGVARRWNSTNRAGPAAVFAFAVAACMVSALSYGAWQTWWLSALWLGSTFSAVILAPSSPDDASNEGGLLAVR